MMTNQKVIQKFSEGAVKGRNRNLIIDGDTIYSFGKHYPLAKRLGNNEYIVNTDKSSQSTERHKSQVKELVKGTGWEAPMCDAKNITVYISENIKDTLNKISTSKTRTKFYYEKFVGLGKYWNFAKARFELESEDVDTVLSLKGRGDIKAKIVACRLDEAKENKNMF